MVSLLRSRMHSDAYANGVKGPEPIPYYLGIIVLFSSMGPSTFTFVFKFLPLLPI